MSGGTTGTLGVRDHYDVIIAGARCAGASTAMLLARAGFDVLVVDPVPRGRDTLSTHALMRGGVMQLHRWGLLDAVRAAGTPAVSTTTFDYEDGTIELPMKERDGVMSLYAPRRTVLDPILVDAALEAGAQVAYGLAVRSLDQDDSGRVRGVWLKARGDAPRLVTADLVIGADGLRSTVARLVHAPAERTASHSTAAIYGYWKGLDRAGYHWYFRPGLGMGTIPTNSGNTGVFVSLSPRQFREGHAEGLESLFSRIVGRIDPDLADALSSAPRTGGLKGFAGSRGFMRRAHGPGWALVGDAGYFRDPLTAHGISDALRDAEFLARTVAAGGTYDLTGYQQRRDNVAAPLFDVTDRVASLRWTLDEVKTLHLELSREMNAAADAITALDLDLRPPVVDPSDRGREAAA